MEFPLIELFGFNYWFLAIRFNYLI